MIYGGGLREPVKVIYFNAVLYNPEYVKDVGRILSEEFGAPLAKSKEFDFSHTDYYVKEMGRPQYKFFECYDHISMPDELPSLKLKSCELEDKYIVDGKRMLNVDPGYVALEKVVAASTKNFSHRIYIGDKIFADMQLTRKGGKYQSLPWTFEDYAFDFVIDFFEESRNLLYDYINKAK